MGMQSWAKNLKLAGKFGWGLGLIGALFIATLLLQYRTLSETQAKYEKLLSSDEVMKAKAMDIESSMLQARRSEKDFLLRKDWAYVDKVKAACGRVLAQAEEWSRIERQAGHLDDLKDAEGVIQDIKKYQDAFLAVAEAWRQKGLNQDVGLRGKFRDAAHALERQINQNADLMVDYLMLRRHEKDYIIRGDKKYVNEADETLAQLRGAITEMTGKEGEKQSLLLLLGQYAKSFHALVAGDGRIEDVIGKMRTAVHKIEPVVQKSVTSLKSTAEKAEKIAAGDLTVHITHLSEKDQLVACPHPLPAAAAAETG